MDYPNCAGHAVVKTGLKQGAQRYRCKGCGRYFTEKPPKFSAQTKAMAVQMYLDSMGSRAIGRVLGASPTAVLNWIRNEHAAVQERVARMPSRLVGAPRRPVPDIIEMDEIYTNIQEKQQRAVVWAAYSRTQRRMVAFLIGDEGILSATMLYRLTKDAVGFIAHIFTNANSCYRLAYSSIDT
ncbi:MAG: IS1 family transposase [Methylobacterium mesophilicum]|nr:IS1 family transposase [Methylobacterium mesophilicum]